MDAVAVAEHRVVHAVEELPGLAVGIALGVALQRLPCCHKSDGGHVGDGLQLALERPGLVLGKGLVYVGDEFVLRLIPAQGIVDIDGHQGEGAHDDEAGQNHTHGGKGHEAVGKDAAESLPQVITHVKLSHCCSTHPFRR